MDFEVGIAVECVDADKYCSFGGKFVGDEKLDHDLVEGRFYPVVDIYLFHERPDQQHIMLLVGGAKHTKFPELGFPASWFRPARNSKGQLLDADDLADGTT